MEEKIDFEKVPYQYPMCLNRQCLKASTCLRQITEQSIPENIKHWIIVSPKHLASIEGNCPYYRSNKKYNMPKDSSECWRIFPTNRCKPSSYI